ncbi:C13 family peptidase [Frateuria aurantia]
MRSVLIAILAFAAGILLMQLSGRANLADLSPLVPTGKVAAAASALKPPATDESSEQAQDDSVGDDWPASAPSPEQVLYDQPRLMQEAIRQLRPRKPGQPNLYAITFAGDGEENVFRNEAEYGAALVDHRLAEPGHSLVLENNPDTLQSRPLADWSNLETGLTALTHVMNPQQDILLLYLTTHGSEDHTLLVDMDPLPLDQIGTGDLARILKKYPFKWKVVVVNACYSGGFVPELRTAGTLVLTAAAADRSSFGCGNDSAATYFGRAWLVDGLNQTPNFIDAFHRADAEIKHWEQRDNLQPSEPQIDIGQGIAGQLQEWSRHLPSRPALPYPSTPAPASTSESGPDAD